jgi:hypothetical protein
MIKRVLLVVNFIIFIALVSNITYGQTIDVIDCQLLDQTGTEYILQNDVSSYGTCFAVNGDDITLNLNGHTVEFYNPPSGDYSFGVICHPNFSPPDRPSNWEGGGDNFKIINGNIIQAASSTKATDYDNGAASHVIYARSCDNIELSNLNLTANSNNDATILRLRGVENAVVNNVIINNNVKTLKDRHRWGQISLWIEGGSGEYEIHDNNIYGGPHKGISISGDFDSCNVYDNLIMHNESYVNGYGFSVSGNNINIHNNEVNPISGRGAHIIGTNIDFHHNSLNLKLAQVIEHDGGQTNYHLIFIPVHGIKLENSGSMNNRIYSNTVIATQPSADYAPPTPLNIDAEGSNANNLIYDNEFTAITYAGTSGGTAGYGVFDTYAPGIYVMQCSSSNPASIYDNHFKSNDRAIHMDGFSCSNLKIYDNTFELIDDATTNAHTITYNNYHNPSHGFNFSNNEFIGYEPDDVWFRSDSYNQLSNFMEFKLTINVVDENQNPVAYPEILIENENGETVFDGIGNGDGQLEKSLLMYEMNRADNPDITYHSPYTIIVGDNEQIVELNENKEITISTEYVSECENWENEHPGWLHCDDFDEDNLVSTYPDRSVGNGGFEISDDDKYLGQSSLRQHYTQGQVDAGWISWWYCDTLDRARDIPCQDEIYFRFYHKFEEGFEGLPPKFARIRNVGIKYVDGELEWDKRFGVNYWISDDGRINADMNIPYSTQANSVGWWTWYSNFSFAEPENVGRWICHEIYIKKNTPGTTDGYLKYWVDNEVVLDKPDRDFIGSTGYNFNEIMLDTYWNGGSPKEQNRYYDNFVISTERIGCMGYENPDHNPGQCTAADTNSDGEISNPEMDSYIESWIDGDISLINLFDAIDKWKNDC